MRTIIALFFACSIIIQAGAQKPTSIGDDIKDIYFKHVLNHQSGKLHLLAMRGKPFIIEFGATWCTGCIKVVEKLLPLQEKYNNKFDVLLVHSTSTKDDSVKVVKYHHQIEKAFGRPIPFKTIVEDSLAKKQFPNVGLPHLVWVNAAGKVQAITGAGDVTERNIAAFAEGKAFPYEFKNDLDIIKPYLIKSPKLDQMGMPVPYTGSYFSGYKPDVLDYSGKSSDEVQEYWLGINLPIIEMYRLATRFTENMIHIQTKRVINYEKTEYSGTREWKDKNLYCYQLVTTRDIKDSIRIAWILSDLNRFFSLNVHYEKRKVRCLLIQGSVTKSLVKDETKIQYTASQITRVFNSMLKGTPGGVILVDGTEGLNNVKLTFSRGSFYTIEGLRKGLEANGLSLSEAEAVVDILVFSDL